MNVLMEHSFVTTTLNVKTTLEVMDAHAMLGILVMGKCVKVGNILVSD